MLVSVIFPRKCLCAVAAFNWSWVRVVDCIEVVREGSLALVDFVAETALVRVVWVDSWQMFRRLLSRASRLDVNFEGTLS